MGPTISNGDQLNNANNEIYTNDNSDKQSDIKNPLDSTSNNDNRPESATRSQLPPPNYFKVNDYSIFKSLNGKIESLSNKIKNLSDRLVYKKCQEITKSLDVIKNSSESQIYLSAMKRYLMEDEDTESSSDDCYSQIDYPYGNSNDFSHKMVNRYQSWLVERCQFQAKWSWLLSEIQSTEFRLKHLKKYTEEIKHLKRRYSSKNDINNEENSRNRHLRLEKRKRIQIHNLLSNDLIKFVSPLYSNDDNSSDKFVHCKCRLGDTGPCILCCGMKNKISDINDFHDKEDLWKSSIMDNSIHTKLSNINDVRNQMKRNVLFNGYVKNILPHWSYPRVRSSLSPILSAPPQPRIEVLNKTESVCLGYFGVNFDHKDYKNDFTNECFKQENDSVINQPSDAKIEIKLPGWKKVDGHISKSTGSKTSSDNPMKVKWSNCKDDSLVEDMNDDVFIKRHEFEELLERRRNYPLTKGTTVQTDSTDKPFYFHGYEYKQSSEQSYDLRLFPMSSDEFRQLSQSNKSYFNRSKRFKKKVMKF